MNEARESAARVEQQRADACRAHQVAEAKVVAQLPKLGADEVADLQALLATVEDGPINVSYPDEPKSVKEALASEDASHWSAALQEEFASIKSMGVYKLVPRSAAAGHRVMKGKPVFVCKRDENGVVVRYKARWVCQGFEAVYGQDYTKTTSPTACMESFHILLHLGAALDYDI